jgi:CHAT domain-containing protein
LGGGIDALTLLAQVVCDVSIARQAETLARWTANAVTALWPAELAADLREHLEERIALAGDVQRALLGKPPLEVPLAPYALARMRVEAILRSLQADAPGTPPKRALLEVALQDALVVVATAASNSEADILDKAVELAMASSVVLLLSQAVLLDADTERALDLGELAVALTRAATTAPGLLDTEKKHRGLALALLNLAVMLSELGDPPTIALRKHILTEADGLLDALRDEGAARAWSCLEHAWLKLEEGQIEGVVELAERGLAAADSEPTQSASHRPLLVQARAMALAMGGDSPSAASLIHTLLAAPASGDQTAHLQAGLQFVRLAEVEISRNDREAALEYVVAGLAFILPVVPFGTEAVHAFRVAAEALRVPEPTLEQLVLRTWIEEVATGPLDVRRVRLAADGRRISADEARLARETHEAYFTDLLHYDFINEFVVRAIQAADRARSRVLLELLPSPRTTMPVGMASSTLTPWHPASNTSARERLVDAANWMVQASNDALWHAGEPVPLEYEAIERLAAESNSTFLLVQPAGERIALLVVRPHDEPAVRWSPHSSEEVVSVALDLARMLRINAVGRGDEAPTSSTNDDESAFVTLSEALVTPVTDLLPPGTPLVLAPYRELWLIPFALLRLPDGRLLGDTHPLSLIPSLAVLQELRSRGHWSRPRPRRAYLVGNPQLAPRQLAMGLGPLLGAAAETTDVAALLRSRGMSEEKGLVVRKGPEADESSYRKEAAGCDLVHLACHARLREPAFSSCLYLAPGAGLDGMLTAAEVPAVALADALVILSACDTGQGRPTADGLVGLGRAFLAAGARAVVLSLWKVADVATATLARHLYTALLDPANPQDLAHALQTAARRTREDLASGAIVDGLGRRIDDRPAHWAPFVALGDASSLHYSGKEEDQ